MSTLSCLAIVPLVIFTGTEITKDAVEVKAKLMEIPSEFPPNELYDYAYVMKYEVIGGSLDKETIYVAHFNPRQKRSKVRDDMQKWVKGKLRRFKVGDVHQMTITPHLEKIWRNAVEDNYATTDRKSTRYWCLQVDVAK
ncbi:hypothetical protein ACFL6C_07420 [Myxococcota bacterium]